MSGWGSGATTSGGGASPDEPLELLELELLELELLELLDPELDVDVPSIAPPHAASTPATTTTTPIPFLMGEAAAGHVPRADAANTGKTRPSYIIPVVPTRAARDPDAVSSRRRAPRRWVNVPSERATGDDGDSP